MTWVRAGKTGDIPDGSGLRFVHESNRIALFRVEGTVYAIGDRCSHAEASLSEGDLFGGEVECPLHGASFDLETGRALTLPATRPVPTYGVKVEGDEVFVEVT